MARRTKIGIPGTIGTAAVVALLVLSGCSRPASTAGTTTGIVTAPSTTTAKPATTTSSASPSPGAGATTAAPKPTTATAAAPAVPSGTLTIAVDSFNRELFDPIASDRSTIQGFSAPMYDYLIRETREGKQTGLVEKYSIAPDGLSWTFNMRKGVTFHDGGPLTAKDVKFSLDRYASKQALDSYVRNMQDRVEIVDDYTVRAYTKGVQPFYGSYVSSDPGNQGVIASKDYFEKVGAETFSQRPVGTGPFKFVSRISGDSVVYESLDKHYRQVPAFKTLKMIVVPEEATRIPLLKTGQADVIGLGLDSAPSVEPAGFKIVSLVGSQPAVILWGAYDPRAKNMPVGDIKVRQALSLAINREELAKTFFHGKMDPPLPPTMLAGQPGIDLAYWTAQAGKVYRYDPVAATQLMKDAGYSGGATLKIYSYPIASSPFLADLAPIIQGYWLKIGVKSEIVPIDFTAFRNKNRSGPGKGPAADLVAQVSVHAPGYKPSPEQALSTYFTNAGSMDLGASAIGQNVKIDQLVSDGMLEPDPNKRAQMTAEALQIAMDLSVLLPLGQVPQLAALGSRVDVSLPGNAVAVPLYAEIMKQRK